MPHPFVDLGSPIVAALGAPASITVNRRAAGTYVDGVFVPGAMTQFDVDAVVQPSGPKDLRQLPENERTEEAITIFASQALLTSTPAGQTADLVLWDGKVYRIRLVEDWIAQAQYARMIAVRMGDG